MTCNDGDFDPTDGCSGCSVTPGWVCDNTNWATAASTCTQSCGNGLADAGEECDDGNIVSLDGCTSTCKLETGWTCTAAAIAPAAAAAGVCTTTCGDGIVVDSAMAINLIAQAETCDDDTLVGCAATCKADNLGYSCTHSASLAGSVCVA